jgi:DUF1680 family protein
MHRLLFIVAGGLLWGSLLTGRQVLGDTRLILESVPKVKMTLSGPVGERVDANINRWLLEAPLANPGMVEMFRVRDRKPTPALVPWAGEFVGKYLISAIQALRMSNDPRLERLVKELIDELLDCQAEDGYLGPFQKKERLLGQWDLWGHYHIMHALLMWHERTADERALLACRRMADLVCKVYLGTNRRVFDAGSHEMNMAIITSLGWLYRVTREEKYLAMMKEVLADFERAGDYYRAGLQDTPFYQTPRPRWESLHCIQGLVEMHRITGEKVFRDSFLRTWQSIQRWDERNTGGFSSGEQATGNPYEDTAIETCCTIAWSALSLDAFKLSADPSVIDALERSFFNGVLGAQHPSGRWWTYNTPMNGVREASAHTIVFQSRAGTPELNCCSVNAPRGLGMLSEWGVMTGDDGVFLHYLGPMKAEVPLADGSTLSIETETRFPVEGLVEITLETNAPTSVPVYVRMPTWSKETKRQGPWDAATDVREGYAKVTCPAKGRVAVSAELDLELRAVAGDLEQVGKVSIYRGPILLAYDQPLNPFDPDTMPAIFVERLAESTIDVAPGREGERKVWLTVDLPAGDQSVRVCDFASAGARGTPYRTWLTARDAGPPAPILLEPSHRQELPPGPMVVRWRRASGDESLRFDLVVREARKDGREMFSFRDLVGPRFIVPAESTQLLVEKTDYTIELVAKNGTGKRAERDPRRPPVVFTIDPNRAPLTPDQLTEFGERSDGMMIEADLLRSAEPTYGWVDEAKGLTFSNDAAKTAGEESRLVYKVKRFPDEYTLLLRVKIDVLPEKLSQLVSAWCKGGDDPLRLCLEGGKLFVRIEGMGGASTSGQEMPTGRWVSLAVSKENGSLDLWMDGKKVARTSAPRRLMSGSTAIGIGRNPRYSGDESVVGEFSHLRFFARPLSNEEIVKFTHEKSPASPSTEPIHPASPAP